jgi:hypothetical protein
MRAWPQWAEREAERAALSGPQWLHALAWRLLGTSVVLVFIAALLPVVGTLVLLAWFLASRLA